MNNDPRPLMMMIFFKAEWLVKISDFNSPPDSSTVEISANFLPPLFTEERGLGVSYKNFSIFFSTPSTASEM